MSEVKEYVWMNSDTAELFVLKADAPVVATLGRGPWEFLGEL